MAIKPDELIPPDSELAHMLLQWSESTDERTWNIANVTNDMIAELEGGPITRMDVYRAIATRCKGKKPNTIRRWAETAADFDADAQRRFAELLSFDHFKAARRLFKDGHVPYLLYPLEWCVEGNDDKITAGRFHTVGEMLANFLPEEKGKSVLRKQWEKVSEGLYDQFIMVDHDNFREQLVDSWKTIDYIVKELGRIEGLDKKGETW